MMASAAAADSAAGSLAASVAPPAPAATPQPAAPGLAPSPGLTSTAHPTLQSPVPPAGPQASAPAHMPLPPAVRSPAANFLASMPTASQSFSPASPQLPMGLGSIALGLCSPPAHSMCQPVAGMAAPPPRPMGGTTQWPPQLSPQLPPAVAAQALTHTGPALPAPSGPHSGAHWRPFRGPGTTHTELKPLPAVSQPHSQPYAAAGQAVYGSGLPLPGQAQSYAAQGSPAAAASAAQSMMPSGTSAAVSNGCREHVDSIAAKAGLPQQGVVGPYQQREVPVSKTSGAHAPHVINALINS